MPVGRVRAVRVVEGVLRRPFGLASLTVEVTGYAKEASAARTLFPFVRVREVRGFLGELLPELADEVRRAGAAAAAGGAALRAVPVLVGRRGLPRPRGSWSGRSRLFALLSGALTGSRGGVPRAGGCSDGRLAVRALRFARTTVLAPAAFRESHTVAQNVFQRRARLADLEVAFGKGTTARSATSRGRAAGLGGAVAPANGDHKGVGSARVAGGGATKVHPL